MALCSNFFLLHATSAGGAFKKCAAANAPKRTAVVRFSGKTLKYYRVGIKKQVHFGKKRLKKLDSAIDFEQLQKYGKDLLGSGLINCKK